MSSVDALIDGKQRAQFAAQGRVLDGSFLGATLLAPGTDLLAPTRVNGTIDARWVDQVDGEAGHLLVQSNLVWAYAITAPDGELGPNHVSAVRETRDLKFYFGSSNDGGIWISTRDGFSSNIDCGYLAEGLLGLPRPNAEVNHRNTTAAPNPSGALYDPRTDLDTLHSTC